MLEYHSEWLSKHNKKVIIDGNEYTVKVRTYKAIFPFKHIVIDAYAEREQEAIDLINSDFDTDTWENIDQQLGGIY